MSLAQNDKYPILKTTIIHKNVLSQIRNINYGPIGQLYCPAQSPGEQRVGDALHGFPSPNGPSKTSGKNFVWTKAARRPREKPSPDPEHQDTDICQSTNKHVYTTLGPLIVRALTNACPSRFTCDGAAQSLHIGNAPVDFSNYCCLAIVTELVQRSRAAQFSLTN